MQTYTSIYKKSFKEASFGASSFTKVFSLFQRLLTKRIKKQVDSSLQMLTFIQRDGVKLGGVFFYIGNRKIRINCKVTGSVQPYSVDFWTNPAKIDLAPNLSLEIPEEMNLIQLLDVIVKTVYTGEASEEEVLLEKKNVDPSIVKKITVWINVNSITKDYIISKHITELAQEFNDFSSLNLDVMEFHANFLEVSRKMGFPSKRVRLAKITVTKPKKAKVILTKDEVAIKTGYEHLIIMENDLKSLIELLKEEMRDVAAGVSNSLLITGTGGIGKTWTVEEVLKNEFGYSRGSGYVYQAPGSITDKALYMLLFKNKSSLIVIDDNDSIWDNAKTAAMLKGALTTEGIRQVSWSTASSVDDDDDDKKGLPSSFEFEGQLVFISNLSPKAIAAKLSPSAKDITSGMAALSRIPKINFNISKEDILRYTEQILDNIYPHVSLDDKKLVFDFYKNAYPSYSSSRSGGGVSIRTFTMTLDKYLSGSPNWQKKAINVL